MSGSANPYAQYVTSGSPFAQNVAPAPQAAAPAPQASANPYAQYVTPNSPFAQNLAASAPAQPPASIGVQYIGPANSPAAQAAYAGVPVAQTPPGATMAAGSPQPAQPAPRSVQTAATPGTPNNVIGNPAAGGMIAMENGLTFNNADRLNAAANAAATYLGMGQPGVTPAQAYSGTQQAVRQEENQFGNNHPLASAALGIAGSLPIMGPAGKLVAAAPGAVTRLLASTGIGGASGAAYGAGANKADPGMGAFVGGVEGTALGAAAPVLVGAARSGANVVNNIRNAYSQSAAAASAQQRAAQVLGGQIVASGANPSDIAAASNVPAANGGMTVAEAAGQTGIGTAAALTRKPGPAGDIASQVLGARQAGRTDRIVQSFQDATGVDPSAARTSAEGAVASGQDTVNPAYSAIRANPAPVMTPELQALVDSDPHVARALNSVLANTANAPNVPDANIWLATRQQLADGVERSPATGQPLANYNNAQMGKAAQNLTAQMNKDVPGFQAAQAAAAQYKAPQASYNAARGMLFGGTKNQTPADVQTLWDAAKTPAQQQAVRQAFAADLYDKAVNQKTLQPSDLMVPGRQQKLAIVFGQPAADNIGKAAALEHTLSKNAAQIIPSSNSITGRVAGHDAEASGMGDVLLEAAPHIAAGSLPHAALALLKGVGSKVLSGVQANNDAAFRKAMADLYLGNASDYVSPVPRSTIRSINAVPYLTNAGIQTAASQGPSQ